MWIAVDLVIPFYYHSSINCVGRQLGLTSTVKWPRRIAILSLPSQSSTSGVHGVWAIHCNHENKTFFLKLLILPWGTRLTLPTPLLCSGAISLLLSIERCNIIITSVCSVQVTNATFTLISTCTHTTCRCAVLECNAPLVVARYLDNDRKASLQSPLKNYRRCVVMLQQHILPTLIFSRSFWRQKIIAQTRQFL